MKRSSKCAIYGYMPGADTAVKGRIRDANFICPLLESLRLASKRDLDAGSAIVGLGLGCRPAAIFWSVWAVVINAINRALRSGLWSHIGIKILERVSPTLAHINSALAIVFVGFICRSVAAADHAAPGAVFGGVRHAVNAAILGYQIGVLAAATLDLSAREMSRSYFLVCAALTQAEVIRAVLFVPDIPDDFQVRESLAN